MLNPLADSSYHAKRRESMEPPKTTWGTMLHQDPAAADTRPGSVRDSEAWMQWSCGQTWMGLVVLSAWRAGSTSLARLPRLSMLTHCIGGYLHFYVGDHSRKGNYLAIFSRFRDSIAVWLFREGSTFRRGTVARPANSKFCLPVLGCHDGLDPVLGSDNLDRRFGIRVGSLQPAPSHAQPRTAQTWAVGMDQVPPRGIMQGTGAQRDSRCRVHRP